MGFFDFWEKGWDSVSGNDARRAQEEAMRTAQSNNQAALAAEQRAQTDALNYQKFLAYMQLRQQGMQNQQSNILMGQQIASTLAGQQQAANQFAQLYNQDLTNNLPQMQARLAALQALGPLMQMTGLQAYQLPTSLDTTKLVAPDIIGQFDTLSSKYINQYNNPTYLNNQNAMDQEFLSGISDPAAYFAKQSGTAGTTLPPNIRAATVQSAGNGSVADRLYRSQNPDAPAPTIFSAAVQPLGADGQPIDISAALQTARASEAAALGGRPNPLQGVWAQAAGAAQGQNVDQNGRPNMLAPDQQAEYQKAMSGPQLTQTQRAYLQDQAKARGMATTMEYNKGAGFDQAEYDRLVASGGADIPAQYRQPSGSIRPPSPNPLQGILTQAAGAAQGQNVNQNGRPNMLTSDQQAAANSEYQKAMSMPRLTQTQRAYLQDQAKANGGMYDAGFYKGEGFDQAEYDRLVATGGAGLPDYARGSIRPPSGTTGVTREGTGQIGGQYIPAGPTEQSYVPSENGMRSAAGSAIVGGGSGSVTPYNPATTQPTMTDLQPVTGPLQGSQLETDPIYQFRLQQAQRELNNRLAARGLGTGGVATQANTNLALGMARDESNEKYNRLMNLVNMGMGGGMTQMGTNAGQQLGSMYQQGASATGNALSNIANAQNAAAQNRSGIYSGLAGAYGQNAAARGQSLANYYGANSAAAQQYGNWQAQQPSGLTKAFDLGTKIYGAWSGMGFPTSFSDYKLANTPASY